jgi:hypothetical protein
MVTTWAVDLKDLAAVYPWQGLELIMVLAAVAAWILWHIAQIRQENADYAEDVRLYGKSEAIKKALDEQHSVWRSVWPLVEAPAAFAGASFLGIVGTSADCSRQGKKKIR